MLEKKKTKNNATPYTILNYKNYELMKGDKLILR